MVNSLRAAEGGLIYHALNRANARLTIFADEDDYAAFDRALAESVARHDIRLVAYKVLPNHFHLVLWPGVNGELSRFMKWLTLTHTQRWHGHRHSAGTGHLDQGRFKSFPVRDDGHLVTVWRYMERNALRAGMVTRAEDWPRCSLRRLAATAPSGGAAPELSAWPVERPPDWVDRVNRPMIAAEEEVMRRSLVRGQPFGAPQWQAKVAGRSGLQSAFRPRGRPRRTTGS